MDGLLWRFPKWYDTSHNSKKCSPERQFFEATFTVHKLCHFKDLQNWDFLEHSNGQIHVIGCHWDVFHQFHAKKKFGGGSCILTDTKFMECTRYRPLSVTASSNFLTHPLSSPYIISSYFITKLQLIENEGCPWNTCDMCRNFIIGHWKLECCVLPQE